MSYMWGHHVEVEAILAHVVIILTLLPTSGSENCAIVK